ncbi:Putative zn(2)Cys(6) fungal-type DNA-binding domain-containing protein [Colletotrichum destructivum]|uniref:Zn(2)Cys(6) fungal-type DNA-binding domain-containing protein n=1 Tax=Colletotrichum destructivum TaxID=34406 RepID=A0AAX4J4V7_9PEZI|nr:Putative zn(2)Cys(6) fungal-type DNA-binding domain-containing protein [Colletotrichum destructivum]
MQRERKYRNILPSPPPTTNENLANEDGEALSGIPNGQEGSNRKRQATTKACNSCHEKKIGVIPHASTLFDTPGPFFGSGAFVRYGLGVCNGLRPCSHCKRRGLACEYATISKTILDSIPLGMKLLEEKTANRHKHAAALLGLLRFVPDDQVHDVLQQLRVGGDAGNIVDSLQGQFYSADDHPFHKLIQVAPPPGQTSLEFELMVRHAAAYSPWALTELPRTEYDSALKLAPSNSVGSPSAEILPISTNTPSRLSTSDSEPSSSGGKPRLMTANSRDGSAGHSFSFSSQDKPGKREAGILDFPPLCDERLLNADILAWTGVKIPSLAARRIVSLYLETDHAITALFDVDLFLNDLMSGGTRFCSRFLVSSLLSWTCVRYIALLANYGSRICPDIMLQQAYASYDLEATAWSYSFYDEAERLLEHETTMGMATPNTVAAMLYLSMSATCHAKSTTAATEHLDHAIDLAKSIGLFGIADEGMPERWPDGATDFLWENALAQTAWGSFVYITTQCARNKTCKIAYPPRLPIPGDAENFEDAKSPDGSHFSAYMGTTFPYLCKLALIAHDMTWVNYGNILRVEGYSMIEHMEVLYRRYLSWADSLPLELVGSGEQRSRQSK